MYGSEGDGVLQVLHETSGLRHWLLSTAGPHQMASEFQSISPTFSTVRISLGICALVFNFGSSLTLSLSLSNHYIIQHMSLVNILGLLMLSLYCFKFLSNDRS